MVIDASFVHAIGADPDGAVLGLAVGSVVGGGVSASVGDGDGDGEAGVLPIAVGVDDAVTGGGLVRADADGLADGCGSDVHAATTIAVSSSASTRMRDSRDMADQR